MNKHQLKRIEQFEIWMECLHLQTLTDELKDTICEEVRNLVNEIQDLNE